ncbi:patatin-like phospholipase family protein [Flocculibacter collagenilyticus]|uniref:patatin-like phospholipase family protein n=1 Tax=Flocculibacter collagenilyticus TaxID=2744479 RepID=UPI0018F35206|nr:patatin-like phospholipase family protein [Flocculibacter collagenilyticus]
MEPQNIDLIQANLNKEELADFNNNQANSSLHLNGNKQYPSGLALSGGGIRSAAFTLGVLRALKTCKLYDCLDYLSTVSGGGYSGAAVTWAKQQGISDGVMFNFIRQNANYLTPTQLLNTSALISVILRTLLLSLLVYIPLTTALLQLAVFNGWFQPLLVSNELTSDSSTIDLIYNQINMFGLLAICLLALFCFLSISYSVYTLLSSWLHSAAGKPYLWRLTLQVIQGILLMLATLFVVIALLPTLHELLDKLIVDSKSESVLISILTIGGSSITALLNVKAQIHGSEKSGKHSELIAFIAAAAMILAILLLCYVIAIKSDPKLWYWTLGFSLVVGLLVNLNNVSLHRMYRDRLMEAFMPQAEPLKANSAEENMYRWRPATDANKFKLSDIKTKPYHIVNTTLVLTNSKNAKYRGRGGDNFILSPKRCGSNATGWQKTAKYMGNKMTLSTAMAISGAAVNPHTGVAGHGITRNIVVSFLMGFLNIRLGFWATHPNKAPLWQIPNYFLPGLKGVFGSGFTEKNSRIELTDGGHFENTGVYELIRRQCPLIIATDGGADPNYQFEDLGNLIEKARLDFDTNIQFSSEYPLEDTLPNEDKNKLGINLATRAFAVAKITYHASKNNAASSPTTGTLIVIKPTLIDGLSQDIYSYKKGYPRFPQQPTSDQFFDEMQYEAYRALGFKAANTMIDALKLTKG